MTNSKTQLEYFLDTPELMAHADVLESYVRQTTGDCRKALHADDKGNIIAIGLYRVVSAPREFTAPAPEVTVERKVYRAPAEQEYSVTSA